MSRELPRDDIPNERVNFILLYNPSSKPVPNPAPQIRHLSPNSVFRPHAHQSIMKTGGPNTGTPSAKADKHNPRGAALGPGSRTGSVADPTNLGSNRGGDHTSSRELQPPPVDPTCTLCHSRMSVLQMGSAGLDRICPLCQSNRNIVSRYNLYP